MNVILDSSAWIELVGLGPLASACAREKAAADAIIVPTVVLYEVYRKIHRKISEDAGLEVVALLSTFVVADLTRSIALDAADLSLKHRLPMADSLVLAHALAANATLVTLDNDFSSLPAVKVLR